MADSSPAFSVLAHFKDNPALVKSGYGKIAEYLSPLLQEAGYELRLMCPVGHTMGELEWQEPRRGRRLKIWTGGGGPYGEDMVPAHLAQLERESGKPALLFFVGDITALNALPQMAARRDILACAWGAVDWETPTPKHTAERWASFLHAWPMSRHGSEVMAADGVPVLPAVWPGVDTEVWHPSPRGAFPETMRSMGFGVDTFNVFSAFANQYQRKGEFEMFAAVREFDRLHPEAKIRFFAFSQVRREWDLAALVQHLGMQSIVKLSDDYHYHMGGYEEADVVRMMASADCVLSLGYEGFGFQTVEAQAMEKPVIGFAAAATPELLEDRGLLVAPEKELMAPAMFRKFLPSAQGTLEALEFVYAHRDDARWAKGREWVKRNASWEQCAAATVERLRAVERRVVDEEMLPAPPPGPLAVERAKRLVEVG